MEMRVEYKASVAKDLANLGRTVAVRVLCKLERTLAAAGHRGSH